MVLAIPLPLSIALVLVIDAVTDLWPSISLAYEQPEENVMRRDPRDPYTHRLVSGRLLAAAYLQVQREHKHRVLFPSIRSVLTSLAGGGSSGRRRPPQHRARLGRPQRGHQRLVRQGEV